MTSLKRSVMHLSVVASCSLGLAACLATAQHHDVSGVKVINGQDVNDPNDPVFHSTVALLTADGSQFCSGTIIAPNTVVSAAHCFATMEDKFTQEGLSIGFGTGPAYDAVLPVSTVVYHKNYALSAVEEAATNQWSAAHPVQSARIEALLAKHQANTITPAETAELTQLSNLLNLVVLPALANPNQQVNDVSVLHFDGTPPAASRPAPIATTPLQPLQTPIEIAGYGLTNEAGNGTHGVLRKATILLKSLNPVAKEVTTLPIGGADTCKGDSGGPAYVHGPSGLMLLGITSRTPVLKPCGQSGSVFTDARFQQGWLACQTVKMNGAPTAACAQQNALVVEIKPSLTHVTPGGRTGPCLSNAEALELGILVFAKQAGYDLSAVDVLRMQALTARMQQSQLCPNQPDPTQDTSSSTTCLTLKEAATLAADLQIQAVGQTPTAQQAQQITALSTRYDQFKVCLGVPAGPGGCLSNAEAIDLAILAEAQAAGSLLDPSESTRLLALGTRGQQSGICPSQPNPALDTSTSTTCLTLKEGSVLALDFKAEAAGQATPAQAQQEAGLSARYNQFKVCGAGG